MPEETFLQHLRSKPEPVRQRIVLAIVILVSPLLFYVWSATNHLGDTTGPSTAETVRDTISGAFNNSAYEQTFGSPGFGKTQTAIPLAETTAPDQGTKDMLIEPDTDTSETSEFAN